jgi:glycosyltransferase involved in cell wall biosynthesis
MPGHGRKARLAYGLAYRTANRVIGVADAVRDWLVESGEVPAAKAVRVYNPVELPSTALASPRELGQPLRIGFTGRLVAVKNPLAIVEALVLLRERGIKAELVFIGDGPLRSAIQSLVEAHDIEEQVTLAGFVSDPTIFLAQCHLYVQPSLSEGFGIAMVEAMGCGLPVIATAEGGMREIIDDGCTGWLLPSASAPAIADAISYAANLKPTALAAVGLAARSSVEKRFNPELYCATLETLYDTVLSYRK